MIDLAQDVPDYGSPAIATDKPDSKKSYPSLYFTCDKEYDIPDTGTATIKFRKIEDSENTRDPADPKYRYELEVQSIEVDGMDENDDDGDEAEEGDVGSAIKVGVRKMMAKKMGGE